MIFDEDFDFSAHTRCAECGEPLPMLRWGDNAHCDGCEEARHEFLAKQLTPPGWLEQFLRDLDHWRHTAS